MSLSKSSFKPETEDQNIQSWADVIPEGKIFEGKNVPTANLFRLLKAISQELNRYQTSLYDVVLKYIPNFDDSFIEEWEQVVGIPDNCFFSGVYSNSERLRNIIIKLAHMNLQTAQDFIDLAIILGLTVTIESGSDLGIFPLTFPATFGAASNTIVITITVPVGSGFPYTFPLTFGVGNVELYQCLVEKQIPATDQVIFEYTS